MKQCREQQQILLDSDIRVMLKIQALKAKMSISAYVGKLVMEEEERKQCKSYQDL